MSALLLSSAPATMSSLEIAELTGKPHNDVLKDIRRILAEAEIGEGEFSRSYLSAQNKELPCYNLPRRECDLVVSGYSVKYRLAIIDRWHELEAKQSIALPDFTNPAEAARAWAHEFEQKQLALQQIEADKPKVRLATLISESSNARCIRVWVKAMKNDNNLCVGEREVFKFLVDKKYIFKPRGEKGYLPYSNHESTGTGYFTVVVDDINGKPRRMLKVTGKGVAHLTARVIDHFHPAPTAALGQCFCSPVLASEGPLIQ